MGNRLRKAEGVLAAGALAILGLTAVTAPAAADATQVSGVRFYDPGTLDYVTSQVGGIVACGDVGDQQLPVLKRIDLTQDDPEHGGVDIFGGSFGHFTTEGNYPDAQLVKFTPTTDLDSGATVTITMPHPVEPYAPSGEVLPNATVPKPTLGLAPLETGTTMSDPVFVPAGADPSDTDAHWDVTVTPPSGTSAQVDLDTVDAYDPATPTSASVRSDSNTVDGAHPSVTFHISDSADAKEDVLIEATVGGVPVDQTKDITFGSPTAPDNACQGYKVSPPGSADNGFSYAFVYDGYAFPIPDAGVTLSSASNQATATLRVPSDVTFDHGKDLYVVALGAVSPPGGTYPAGAFSVSTSADPLPAFPGDDHLTYAANLHVDGGASSLDVSPEQAQVSDNGGPTASATVTDKYHNPIKGKTVEMFQGTATHAQFAPLVPPTDGALPQSGDDGSVAYTVTDTCAETVDARAFDVNDSDLQSDTNPQGNVQLGYDQLVTFTAAPPVQPSRSVPNPECGGNAVSAIHVDSATAPADGLGVDTVTITLVDRFGNPDARHAIVLSPSSTSTNGTHASVTPAAGYAGTLCGTVADEGCTDSSGAVKFDITDTTAETVNLGITDTTAAVTWPAGGSADLRDYAQVQFQPVSADASTVTASPTTAPADGAPASTVTVTLKDAAGQPFAGRLVSVEPDPATTPAGDTSVVTAVDPATGSSTEARSGSDGTAQFYVADNTANQDVDYQATVLLDDLVVTQRATIHWVTGGASLAANRSRVVADGSDGSVLTFRLSAPGAAPLAGEPVTLTSKTAGGTTATVGTSTTDADGTALFVVTGTTPQTLSYTATSTFATTVDQCPSVTFNEGNCTVTAGPVNVTFIPKPASFTLTASPAEVPADGTSISQVTVQALDSGGHPINGLSVRLAATSITASTTGGPTTDPAAALAPITTGLDGTATFAVKSGDAERVTFDAQYLSTGYTINPDDSTTAHPAWTPSGGTDTTVDVKFAMTEAQASTVTAAPSTAIADGSSTITVTVTLCTVAICDDPSGLAEPISGHPVVLRGGSASASITPTSSPAGITDSTGAVTFAVTDTQPQTLTLYAQDVETGAITRAHVSITFEETEADASTVTASPTAVPAGGPTTTVTVTLRQWDGSQYTPIGGHEVVLHTGSTTTHVSPASAATDSTGVATFTVWDSAVETVHITASDGSTTLSSSATVQFVAAELNRSTLVANPASTPAQGAPITLTVTLLDGNDQPLAGHLVSIGHTTPTTTVTPLLTGGYTDSYGHAQFAVRDSAVEIETVTATDTTTGVQLVQTATLSFITDEANQSAISASPALLPAGGPTTTVTVTLHDSGGYPLTGHQVALSSPSTTVSGMPTVTTTDGSGRASFTVSDPVVETAVLTATDRTTGAVVDETVAVTFVADEANQSTADASTNMQVVRKNVTVTVVLRNSNDNPLAGHTVTLATGSNTATYCPVGWTKPCKQSVNAATDATGTVRYILTDTTPERLPIRVTDATTGVTLYATLVVTFAK